MIIIFLIIGIASFIAAYFLPLSSESTLIGGGIARIIGTVAILEVVLPPIFRYPIKKRFAKDSSEKDLKKMTSLVSNYFICVISAAVLCYACYRTDDVVLGSSSIAAWMGLWIFLTIYLTYKFLKMWVDLRGEVEKV